MTVYLFDREKARRLTVRDLKAANRRVAYLEDFISKARNGEQVALITVAHKETEVDTLQAMLDGAFDEIHRLRDCLRKFGYASFAIVPDGPDTAA